MEAAPRLDDVLGDERGASVEPSGDESASAIVERRQLHSGAPREIAGHGDADLVDRRVLDAGHAIEQPDPRRDLADHRVDLAHEAAHDLADVIEVAANVRDPRPRARLGGGDREIEQQMRAEARVEVLEDGGLALLARVERDLPRLAHGAPGAVGLDGIEVTVGEARIEPIHAIGIEERAAADALAHLDGDASIERGEVADPVPGGDGGGNDGVEPVDHFVDVACAHPVVGPFARSRP